MSDCGNNGNFRCKYGPGDAFAVKCLQILKRSAASGQNGDINAKLLIHLLKSSDDFILSFFALNFYGKNLNAHIGKPPVDYIQHIVNHRTGWRSDQNDFMG